MSHPDVPTFPSNTGVEPSDSKARNHAAVPLCAIVICAIAFAVNTPLDAAPNAVALKRNVASRFCEVTAVSGFDG